MSFKASSNQVIETGVIGHGTIVGEFVFIRAGVEISRNVVIHSPVVIDLGMIIGDEVELLPFFVHWSSATGRWLSEAATRLR